MSEYPYFIMLTTGLAALAGLSFWLKEQFRGSREEPECAHNFGASFKPASENASLLIDELSHFALFRGGVQKNIRNPMTGTTEGVETLVFDFSPTLLLRRMIHLLATSSRCSPNGPGLSPTSGSAPQPFLTNSRPWWDFRRSRSSLVPRCQTIILSMVQMPPSALCFGPMSLSSSPLIPPRFGVPTQRSKDTARD